MIVFVANITWPDETKLSVSLRTASPDLSGDTSWSGDGSRLLHLPPSLQELRDPCLLPILVARLTAHARETGGKLSMRSRGEAEIALER